MWFKTDLSTDQTYLYISPGGWYMRFIITVATQRARCSTCFSDVLALISYLEGYWAQLQWPSCPPHSGSGRKADTALLSRPLPPGCVMGPLAAPGSSRGRPCDCWCPTRREPRPLGPWPGSTYGQGWCWRERSHRCVCYPPMQFEAKHFTIHSEPTLD